MVIGPVHRSARPPGAAASYTNRGRLQPDPVTADRRNHRQMEHACPRLDGLAPTLVATRSINTPNGNAPNGDSNLASASHPTVSALAAPP